MRAREAPPTDLSVSLPEKQRCCGLKPRGREERATLGNHPKRINAVTILGIKGVLPPSVQSSGTGADDVLRDSGAGPAIPRCLQRFVWSSSGLNLNQHKAHLLSSFLDSKTERCGGNCYAPFEKFGFQIGKPGFIELIEWHRYRSCVADENQSDGIPAGVLSD
jgi:hypothetical protein